MVKKFQHFPKGVVELAYKHIKRCTTLLVIRKIEIEVVRCHYTPIKMPQIRKTTHQV